MNTYNNQMRQQTPPMLQNSKVLIPQNLLCNLKAIKSLGSSFAWRAHNLLDINRNIDKTAQGYRHTKKIYKQCLE